MSIADISDERLGGQRREHERTPPHDMLAEQSALGGMLLSKDAVADVIETLRGVDFYVPKHELIFEAVLTLYSHGEPTDVVAVTDELIKTGELQRAGGADYLHTLTSIVPTAANAGYYASIVAERALLRRLVDAGTRIVQMGYSGQGEALDLVNNAQAEIYGVTGADAAEDYVPLEIAVSAAVDEIEAARGRDGQMTGIPTGFSGLDQLTNGLHAGQMIIIAARPAMGKSTLALDFARVRRDQARLPHDLLLARDGAQRDRDAPDERRGCGAAAEHAQGNARLARLDDDRLDARPHQRRAPLHRRQPEHDAGRDPREVPPPQAARGSEDGRHRLPAAHDERQARRVAPAGGRRSSPVRSSSSRRSCRCRSSRCRS